MVWRDRTVLSAEELSIVQISMDIVQTARSLLNGTALGDDKIHEKANPELLAHMGWPRAKGLLRHALQTFERVIQLPARSEGTGARS